jgi:hypothetical protein|uniref:Uncharacterized protein n=1 Tax=Myoviridae sp. ctWb16 TaxID=2827690 RepID=A0A8S5T1L6_9CAUD|nr:MAG TPA: hypothetical protein [Myoviridae sp. ctWb16]DAV17863.1 MAG TPA: hypothetical protein [Caudoviricetes sp.]
MKKVSLKKAIEIIGGTDIELKAGYYYCSGFFNLDGQLYYISTADVRTCPMTNNNFIMFRTAKNRQDYTGGTNLWYFNELLAKKGYEIGSCRYKTA